VSIDQVVLEKVSDQAMRAIVSPRVDQVISAKGAMLLKLASVKNGLLQLGVKADLFDQVLTYAASLDPQVALRATPWVLELADAVGKAVMIYAAQPESYWALAKQLGLSLPQLVELRKRVKLALEVWANRPGVLRVA
jgi:hypothetical protein